MKSKENSRHKENEPPNQKRLGHTVDNCDSLNTIQELFTLLKVRGLEQINRVNDQVKTRMHSTNRVRRMVT
jgi:hypothetical protein